MAPKLGVLGAFGFTVESRDTGRLSLVLIIAPISKSTRLLEISLPLHLENTKLGVGQRDGRDGAGSEEQFSSWLSQVK